MKDVCLKMRTLLTGYVDNELEAAEQQRVEEHIRDCADCREELRQLEDVVTAASSLRVEEPPEEVWDTFLDNVYNRIERRTGWAVFLVGVAALFCIGAYYYAANPWAPARVKIILAAPLLGLAILFVSVLRQRLLVAKTDRYSKEVKR